MLLSCSRTLESIHRHVLTLQRSHPGSPILFHEKLGEIGWSKLLYDDHSMID